MYQLTESKRRRTERERERGEEKRTVAEIVAEMVHSERAAEVLHQWINTNRMEYHRPPPLSITYDNIGSDEGYASGPGSVRYRPVNYMQFPIVSEFWTAGFGPPDYSASLICLIRGLLRPGVESGGSIKSWGYLQ